MYLQVMIRRLGRFLNGILVGLDHYTDCCPSMFPNKKSCVSSHKVESAYECVSRIDERTGILAVRMNVLRLRYIAVTVDVRGMVADLRRLRSNGRLDNAL